MRARVVPFKVLEPEIKSNKMTATVRPQLLVHGTYRNARFVGGYIMTTTSTPKYYYGIPWAISNTRWGLIFKQVPVGTNYRGVLFEAKPTGVAILKRFRVSITAAKKAPHGNVTIVTPGDETEYTNPTVAIQGDVNADEVNPNNVWSQIRCGYSTTHFFPTAPKLPDLVMEATFYTSINVTDPPAHNDFIVRAQEQGDANDSDENTFWFPES